MTSVKGPKEKSSTPKFWKKFSLNKNKTSSSGVGPEQIDIDDDKSVKSKRLSGLLVSRKQSMASLRKHPQLQTGVADTETLKQPEMPPPSTYQQLQQQQYNSPPPPPTPPPAAESADEKTIKKQDKDHKEKETAAEDHVNTPSKKDDPDQVPKDGSGPVVTEDHQRSNTTTATVDTNAVKALRTAAAGPRQRTNSNNVNTSSRLVPPKAISKSLEKPKLSHAASADRLPRPTTNKSTQSTSSSLSASSSSGTRQSPPSSRLRKPSQIPAMRNAGGSSNSSNAVSNKSSQSSLSKHNSSSNVDQQDDHQSVIKELQEELEKERSVVKVLQGQKEAITKDLDYFSQMMDELMEEKEALQQKYDALQKAYDEEKETNRTREEDLNVLMEKLKMSNENAREKSFEYDKFKSELETLQQQLEEERGNFKSRLKDKDNVISRLKNELAQAHEENKILKNTIDNMIKAQAAHTHHNSPTNGSSPKPSNSSYQHAQKEDPTRQHSDDQSNSSFDPQSPIPGPAKHHHSFAPQAVPAQPRNNTEYGYDTPQSSVNSNHSIGEQHPFSLKTDDLDDQLMRLTKEKEKLQSDYSKIPISGGGPMSRRRKEELEEMLDEVDSQLSRVKQKIRRS